MELLWTKKKRYWRETVCMRLNKGYSHKGVVDESPLPWPLQHVVEVILEAAVPCVPAAALRAVGQRLPQQAEPSALLPVPSQRTCSGQDAVPDVIHGGPARLHIFQRVLLPPASRWGLQPQPGAAALIAAGTSRHGITSAGRWKPGRHSHVAKYSSVGGYLITLTCSQRRESNNWWVQCDLILSDHFSLVNVWAVPVWTLWSSAQGWGRAGLWRSRSIEAFVEGRALSHPPTRFLPPTQLSPSCFSPAWGFGACGAAPEAYPFTHGQRRSRYCQLWMEAHTSSAPVETTLASPWHFTPARVLFRCKVK